MFEKISKPCIEKEGASENDVKEAKAHQVASTKAGKCLRACFMESIGVVRFQADWKITEFL